MSAYSLTCLRCGCFFLQPSRGVRRKRCYSCSKTGRRLLVKREWLRLSTFSLYFVNEEYIGYFEELDGRFYCFYSPIAAVSVVGSSIEAENWLTYMSYDMRRFRQTARCICCGRVFFLSGVGRPRMKCYDCAPIRSKSASGYLAGFRSYLVGYSW